MHPVLQMKNIRRLPPSIRDIVSKAAGKSRTSTDVATARRILDVHPSLSSSQRLAFLPVFFANLDPEKIPTSDDLDNPLRQPVTREDVLCALSSLDAVLNLTAPEDVGPSLWPRVWAWFDFVHVHRDLFIGIGVTGFPPEKIFYLNFIKFVDAFRCHSATRTVISTGPRFWACLVKGWMFLPEIDDPLRTTLLQTLADFFGGMIAHPEASSVEAMVQAAGSVEDLASLILLFVRTTINGPLLGTAIPVTYIHHILLFITSADGCPPRLVGHPSARLGPLIISLCLQDFPSELVSTLLFLCDRWQHDEQAPMVIENCITLLEHMILRLPANVLLSALIDRGLLRALALITLKCGSGTEARRVKLHYQIRSFLHQILPAGLAFYHVVSSFEKSYPALDEIVSQQDFKGSPLSGEWDDFCILAEDRAAVLDEYFSDDYVASKACDNSKCGSIKEADSMAGCCSGCQAFYYCSRECQIADWRAGHREYCDSHEHLLLTQHSANPKLTFKERSFIRMMLLQTYFKMQRSIYAQQVKILAALPADPPPLLFTLFDFCKLPPGVNVEVVGAEPPEVPDCIADIVDPFSDEWVDIASRAESGRGRADLHAVQLLNGLGPHVWIIPLRSGSAAIYEAVRRLADRVRNGEVEGETEILDAVDGILTEHEDVLEIY
ncbi:hypothetical protein FB45DRAFT_1066450 [Roridomyces roridus]|uniref:MYND-type domain-containing protein n=1 Tax=Roridomyces roridus TaxID=1738132 RepID=A0AAD7FB46_9AGAR|nr:hypothetical protein FB45DRAFT_1066450 [Roridomyces roridus]